MKYPFPVHSFNEFDDLIKRNEGSIFLIVLIEYKC